MTLSSGRVLSQEYKIDKNLIIELIARGNGRRSWQLLFLTGTSVTKCRKVSDGQSANSSVLDTVLEFFSVSRLSALPTVLVPSLETSNISDKSV